MLSCSMASPLASGRAAKSGSHAAIEWTWGMWNFIRKSPLLKLLSFFQFLRMLNDLRDRMDVVILLRPPTLLKSVMDPNYSSHSIVF